MTATPEMFSVISDGYQSARNKFEDAMPCPDGWDYEDFWTDNYDNSIEFKGVPDGWKIEGELGEFLAKEGFSLCFLNYECGTDACFILKEPQP